MDTLDKSDNIFDSSEKTSDDILDYLNKKSPDEDLFISDPASLLDLNSEAFFERVNQKEVLTKDDLEELLKHEEQLLEAVHFLVSENARVNKLVGAKEDKVIAGVQLIKNQREWIHSLLEDNVTVREEVELLQEDKHNIESSQISILSEARNERDEWRDKYDGVTEKVNDLTYLLEDKEKQQNKTSGDMKKMNIHKKALLGQISELDIRHKKNKMYIGMLASAATLIFALFLGSMFSESTAKNEFNRDELTKVDSKKSGQKKDLDSDAIREKFVKKDLVEIVVEEDRTKVVSPEEMKDIFGPEEDVADNRTPDPAHTKIKNNVKTVQYYIVKKNDSYWKIAEKFYGNGTYGNKIKRDNKLKKGLRPGVKLVITSLDEE